MLQLRTPVSSCHELETACLPKSACKFYNAERLGKFKTMHAEKLRPANSCFGANG